MAKKISLISLYVLLAVIIVLIIVGACVPKSFLPEIGTPFAVYCKNEDGTAQSYSVDKQTNEEAYNKFMQKFNNAFEESFITAMFAGHLSREERIEPCQTTAPTFTDWSIRFTFTEEQVIKINGKEYKDPTNTASVLKYNQIYFEFNDNRVPTDCKMFYVVKQTVNGVQTTQYYSRKVLCNFNQLYNFVAEHI